MKLTKLEILRYRGVAPGTQLVFGPSFNLVLGEHGTGKSALLDLISLLLTSDFSGLMQEELSLRYGITLPGMALRISVRNERRSATSEPAHASPERSALLFLGAPEVAPEFEPVVEVELQLDSPATQLVMHADSTCMAWEVDGKPGHSQSMQWALLGRSVWVLLFLASQYLETELKDRLKALLRRTFLLGPSRFDELLGTFGQIGTIRYAMEMHGDEVFPLGLMALPSWLPGWLRERVQGQPSASAIDIGHEDVKQSFLAKFVALAGFTAGTFRVELIENRAFEDGGRVGFGRFGFRFTRRDGSAISEAELSHGQKRLLSFLYYLDVNADFAVADELASGLSARWVEACLSEIGDRQSFLTSHNPLLYEHVPLASLRDLRSSLILCRRELDGGRERCLWSNPEPELAQKLSSARQGGSPSLADLLRAHGLL